jgi:hypothetical protein
MLLVPPFAMGRTPVTPVDKSTLGGETHAAAVDDEAVKI